VTCTFCGETCGVRAVADATRDDRLCCLADGGACCGGRHGTEDRKFGRSGRLCMRLGAAGLAVADACTVGVLGAADGVPHGVGGAALAVAIATSAPL